MKTEVTTVKTEGAKGRGGVLKHYKFGCNKPQNLVSLKGEECSGGGRAKIKDRLS